MQQRDQSLDALRGLAILAMVLSSSIAFGILPGWMYHAQVPPPNHQFNPGLAGISWVDLVFPFFLFSMGAAIPLSLAKLEKQNAGFFNVCWIALRRYGLLAFFALFTFHMRAWVIAEHPSTIDYLLSIVGFILLCLQFYEYKGEKYKTLFAGLKIMAFAAAVFLLYYLPFNKGKGFQLDKTDIIILVLANMAFFGTLIFWLTRKQPMLRIGLLAFIMAIFLGAKEKGSWNEMFFNYSPLTWLYKFYYLKYLFIILPGTLAGEWLLQAAKEPKIKTPNTGILLISLLCFSLVLSNVTLLFGRLLILNLVLTTVLCLTVYFLLRKTQVEMLKKFGNAGFYLLLLGLAFEAFEGGVKKDVSTYSYYFVTAGLAFYMLIGLYGCQFATISAKALAVAGLAGRNPMVAYVAGNLLLIPLLNLTGTIDWLNQMKSNVYLGFLRGILFTGIVACITILFTRKGWYWKT